MKYIAFIFIFVALFLCSCNNIKVNDTQSTDLQTEDTLRTITEEMAYEGVNNYCHKEYDWSVAKDNPIGLHMEFYEDGDYIVSTWHPEHNYQGWVDTMHGGIDIIL